MAQERLANLGYFGLAKMSGDTVVRPTDFIPLYSETLNTNLNTVEQTPIYGEKFANFDVVQGQRSHRGDFTVMAEPNTTARLFDMLLTKVSTSGAGPYTHTFELSKTTNPNPYTIDISSGRVVSRYIGVQASQITPAFNGNEMRWTVTVSALASFTSRKLAGTPSGDGPYTVVLDTFYDPNPTYGLVSGDLVEFVKSDGTTIAAEVQSVEDETTITVDTDVTSLGVGDIIHLAPVDVDFTLLQTLLWSRSEFRFASTAAAALSAVQTRVESGSSYDIIHSFENEDGAMRSGGFDPAALPRITGRANLSITKIFDGPEDLEAAQNLSKSSLAVRHFAGATNQYEVRIVLNHLKTDGQITPNLQSDNIEYSEITYKPIYDQSDGKGMQVVVINNLPTI